MTIFDNFKRKVSLEEDEDEEKEGEDKEGKEKRRPGK